MADPGPPGLSLARTAYPACEAKARRVAVRMAGVVPLVSARAGRWDEVEYALKVGLVPPGAPETDHAGCTLLHYAAGFLSCYNPRRVLVVAPKAPLRPLSRYHKPVTRVRLPRFSLAQHAAGAPRVRRLLAHGADPNAVDGQGCTPLAWAARCGNSGVMAALVAGGAELLLGSPQAGLAFRGARDSHWWPAEALCGLLTHPTLVVHYWNDGTAGGMPVGEAAMGLARRLSLLPERGFTEVVGEVLGQAERGTHRLRVAWIGTVVRGMWWRARGGAGVGRGPR